MRVSKLFSFAGFFAALIILCRCDTAGNIDSPSKNYFIKYIGDEGDQEGVDMEVNPDGTMILFGTTPDTTSGNADHTQLYVVKVDAQGNLLKEAVFGGPLDDQARDVELTTDGRIVIVGNTYVSGSAEAGGSRDILVMTLTQDLTLINKTQIGYTNTITGGPSDDDATTVTQTNDGFVVAGSTDNIDHSQDAGLTLFNRLGLIIRLYDDLKTYDPTWPSKPGLGQGLESVTTKIVQLADGTFYAFGFSKWTHDKGNQPNYDYWYFSLGTTGGSTGVYSVGEPNSDEKLKSVAVIPTDLGGGYLLGGVISGSGGNDDIYATRLRNPLAFDDSDPQFPPSPLGLSLGQLKDETVSVTISRTTGYYILANQSITNGNNNLLLYRITGEGKKDPAWSSNPVIYGGQGDDFACAVRELPDGKLVVFGTMAIGQKNIENKMVLIKVNQSGRFAE